MLKKKKKTIDPVTCLCEKSDSHSKGDKMEIIDLHLNTFLLDDMYY